MKEGKKKRGRKGGVPSAGITLTAPSLNIPDITVLSSIKLILESTMLNGPFMALGFPVIKVINLMCQQ